MSYKQELTNNGYCVISGVLNPNEIFIATEKFHNWFDSIPYLKKYHHKINPHGILKYHNVGQTEHAWYIRTLPQILYYFSDIWNTTPDNLITGFDGCCYIPTNSSTNTNCWTHTDQSPLVTDLQCYQSFVSLTTNKDNSFVLYKDSHKLHEKYFIEYKQNLLDTIQNLKKMINNITNQKEIKQLSKQLDKFNTELIKFDKNKSNNWQLIDKSYLDTIKDTRIKLSVKPGDLVIWDSRLFHQNEISNPNEERLIQYICMLPKNHPKNTLSQQKKRLQYFKDLRTTSHWPCPLKVNSKQPNTWGDNELKINYDELDKPNLENYLDTIKTLL